MARLRGSVEGERQEVRGVYVRRRQSRLPQRHDSALRQSRGRAVVAADHRPLQQESPRERPRHELVSAVGNGWFRPPTPSSPRNSRRTPHRTIPTPTNAVTFDASPPLNALVVVDLFASATKSTWGRNIQRDHTFSAGINVHFRTHSGTPAVRPQRLPASPIG